MAGFDVPPGKKKPYPYQDVRLFNLRPNEKISKRGEFRGNECWFCGCKKHLFREFEATFLAGVTQAKFCVAFYQCPDCNIPIWFRFSTDWPQMGYTMVHSEPTWWSGRYQRKWQSRKSKLEDEERALEQRLADVKRLKASIK